MQEDAQIIQQVLQGNDAAIDELVHRYYDEIFRYIVRMGCPNEEAMDLTQEVFIIMMKSIATYKEQGHFRAWLYKIAHNQTMNVFKKKKRELVYFINEEKSGVMTDFSETVADQAFVEELLKQLPAKQRDVVILKYYHGFKSKEIAKITKSTLPAVKSRLFQALQKLKKYIKEES